MVLQSVPLVRHPLDFFSNSEIGPVPNGICLEPHFLRESLDFPLCIACVLNPKKDFANSYVMKSAESFLAPPQKMLPARF